MCVYRNGLQKRREGNDGYDSSTEREMNERGCVKRCLLGDEKKRMGWM